MKLSIFSCGIAALSTAGCLVLVACDKKEAGAPAVAPPTSSAVPPAPTPTPPVPAPTPAPNEVPAAATPGSAEATPAPSAEAAAIAAFKAEVEKIKSFMEANQASPNESVALANARQLFKMAAAVKTDGLPADLAAAYQEMNRVMQGVSSCMNDLPVPIEQLPDLLAKEKAKGAAADAELQAKLEAFKTTYETLQKDGEAAAATLKEVGARYGIESFTIGGQ